MQPNTTNDFDLDWDCNQDLYIGDVFILESGCKKIIIHDLVIVGFNPNDPEDCGSFEEYLVEYFDVNNKFHSCDETRFRDYLKRHNAKRMKYTGTKQSFHYEYDY